LLDKNFVNEVDFQVKKAASAGGAGLNKEQIMLTVNTFKKFCLKANEIHDYYIQKLV